MELKKSTGYHCSECLQAEGHAEGCKGAEAADLVMAAPDGRDELRTRFEAWHSDTFLWISGRCVIVNGNYADQRTQERWEAWQAASTPASPASAPEASELAKEADRRKRLAFTLGQCIHNMVVAEQSAWIEWKHGSGAEAAMEWIENGLMGPGHLPKHDGQTAQEYFNANVDERMDPPTAAPLPPVVARKVLDAATIHDTCREVLTKHAQVDGFPFVTFAREIERKILARLAGKAEGSGK